MIQRYPKYSCKSIMSLGWTVVMTDCPLKKTGNQILDIALIHAPVCPKNLCEWLHWLVFAWVWLWLSESHMNINHWKLRCIPMASYGTASDLSQSHPRGVPFFHRFHHFTDINRGSVSQWTPMRRRLRTSSESFSSWTDWNIRSKKDAPRTTFMDTFSCWQRTLKHLSTYVEESNVFPLCTSLCYKAKWFMTVINNYSPLLVQLHSFFYCGNGMVPYIPTAITVCGHQRGAANSRYQEPPSIAGPIGPCSWDRSEDSIHWSFSSTSWECKLLGWKFCRI